MEQWTISQRGRSCTRDAQSIRQELTSPGPPAQHALVDEANCSAEEGIGKKEAKTTRAPKSGPVRGGARRDGGPAQEKPEAQYADVLLSQISQTTALRS